jgi:hypothetical protein
MAPVAFPSWPSIKRSLLDSTFSSCKPNPPKSPIHQAYLKILNTNHQLPAVTRRDLTDDPSRFGVVLACIIFLVLAILVAIFRLLERLNRHMAVEEQAELRKMELIYLKERMREMEERERSLKGDPPSYEAAREESVRMTKPELARLREGSEKRSAD